MTADENRIIFEKELLAVLDKHGFMAVEKDHICNTVDIHLEYQCMPQVKITYLYAKSDSK